MDDKEYFWLTRKKEPKTKPKSQPLPKATQKYLEAEATLKDELEDLAVGFEQKFQPIHTKHWRFDFHIVKLNLLIEIAGSPWSVGRGGRKIANSFNKYDLALDRGYVLERLEPHQIESGYAINWIKSELARFENGSDQTISSTGLTG
ncbi:hypothetical protein Q5M52_10880 [Acinetobacter nosocomialis]|uniref:hypothetical protein n=1 Tax=Acinetobacter nosocomialis TaxID=106654 RepID=UPI0027008523|nr:hypothetical protein [Acinetobacter nosocomialis]MDO7539765.1 hypothetical protein [Acinetobacter nosocomialis]